MEEQPKEAQPVQGSQRGVLLGIVLIVVLLIGIVALLVVRGQLDAIRYAPTATFSPLQLNVTTIDPGVDVQSFTLPSSIDGAPVTLGEPNGLYTLIFFGYTHCPDFCPISLGEMAQVKRLLGENAAAQVGFVFISVDPARDTPEALATYLSNFDAGFVGLSGDDETLMGVASDYGLYYLRREDEAVNGAYPVDHSTASYLLDRNGDLRAVFSYEADADTIAAHIQTLIAQEAG